MNPQSLFRTSEFLWRMLIKGASARRTTKIAPELYRVENNFGYEVDKNVKIILHIPGA